MSSTSVPLDIATDLEDDQLNTDVVDFLNHDHLVESIAQSIVNEVIDHAEDIAELNSALDNTDHDAERPGVSENPSDVPDTAPAHASTEAQPANPQCSFHLGQICVVEVTTFSDSGIPTVTSNLMKVGEPDMGFITLPPDDNSTNEMLGVDSLTALEMNEEIINVSPSESMENASVDDSDMMLRNIAELALTYGETVDQLLEQEASLLTNELNELIAGIDQAQNILNSTVNAPRPTRDENNRAQLCPVLQPHTMVEQEIRRGLLELSRMLTLVNMDYAGPRRNADLELSRGLRDSEVKTRTTANSSRSNVKIKREDLARIISDLENSLPKRYEATKTEMKNITEAVKALNESSSHLLSPGQEAPNASKQNDQTTKVDYHNSNYLVPKNSKTDMEVVTNVTELDNTQEEEIPKEHSSKSLDNYPNDTLREVVNEKQEFPRINMDDYTNASDQDDPKRMFLLFEQENPIISLDDYHNKTEYKETNVQQELPPNRMDNATMQDTSNIKQELPPNRTDNTTMLDNSNVKQEFAPNNMENATVQDTSNVKQELPPNRMDNATVQDASNVEKEIPSYNMDNATTQENADEKQELPPNNMDNATMPENADEKQEPAPNNMDSASTQENTSEKQELPPNNKDDSTNTTTQDIGNKKKNGDTCNESDLNPGVILNADLMRSQDVAYETPNSEAHEHVPLSVYESQENLLTMYGDELNITEEASRIVRDLADNAVSLSIHEIQSTTEDYEQEAAYLINKLVDDVVNTAYAKVQQLRPPSPARRKPRAPDHPAQDAPTQKVRTDRVGDTLGASPCAERSHHPRAGLDDGVGGAMATSISDESSHKKQRLSFHQRMRNAFVNTFTRHSRQKGTKNRK